MNMTQGRHDQHGDSQHMQMKKSGYGKLTVALILSFLAMYPLTMIFVDEANHFYINLSNAYMAMLMVAPMGLIMLFVMRDMFPNKSLNLGLMIGFVGLFVVALLMGRSRE